VTRAVRELDTDRLLLRPFRDTDAGIHRLVFADPEVCRYYCRQTRTEDETREWLVHRRWQVRSDDNLGFLAVVRRCDEQLLGLVALQMFLAYDLRFEDDPDEPCSPIIVELSYAFGREYRGQGYATEACRAVIDYGFGDMGIARLTNAVDPENTSSVALCERLGFRKMRNVRHGHEGWVWVLDNPACSGAERGV
jgi:[ribosomal protein S5]-alanine N-acetyltransferase